MNVFDFLRPNKIRIALSIILTTLSSIIVTDFKWTTKMTWYAYRGFPLSFLKIYDYVKGERCQPYNFCMATNIQDFYTYSFLVDLVVWYLVSCVITLGFLTMKRKFKQPEQ